MRPSARSWVLMTLVLVSITGCAEQEAPEAEAEAPDSVGPTEGHVDLDGGLRLYYRSYGEGGDPLVLLHGGPGMSFMGVGPDLLPLAGQRRLVMYDQRGGGRSDPDPDAESITAETHVRDIETFRQALGLERMTLIGHSWGCTLAALYAAEHPDRVERLLLIGPMEPSRELLDRRMEVQNPVKQRAEDELARMAESGQPPDDPCRARFEITQGFYYHDPAKMAVKRGDYCDVPEGVPAYNEVIGNAVIGSLGDFDLAPLLAGLEMPALVVEGAQSRLPLEGEYAWARALPNSRLWLIDQVGHAYPFVEAPDVFFPGVERFLQGDWPEGAVTVPEM